MVEHDLIGQKVLCLGDTPRTRFRVREDSFSSPKNELGFPGLKHPQTPNKQAFEVVSIVFFGLLAKMGP